MKSIYSLILLLLISSFAMSQEWEEEASLPNNFKKHHPVTFALNGIGYSFVGSDSFGNPTSSGQKYDPLSDSWSSVDDFPGLSRGFSYGVHDGEFAYMGFGLNLINGQYLNDLWKFDPISETWEELTACPCTPRSHPAFIYLDGKIFIGAGGSEFGNLIDWWEYDIVNDSWSEKDDIPGPERHHPYYFGLDGYAYVGFGHGDGIFKDFYRYDPSDESWTQMNDFPGEARVAGTQFSHDGNGYVLSGDGDDHWYMPEGEFWKYYPDTDTWEELPAHPGLSKWAPGSFLIDGKVYLLQGENRFVNQFPANELTNEMWSFDLDLFNSPFSISENLTDSGLIVYPNPASSELTIELSDFRGDDMILTISSALGQTVLSQRGTDINNIDISELESGSYTIQMRSSNGVITTKFIKQ